jgi:hypothetical protein
MKNVGKKAADRRLSLVLLRVALGIALIIDHFEANIQDINLEQNNTSRLSSRKISVVECCCCFIQSTSFFRDYLAGSVSPCLSPCSLF